MRHARPFFALLAISAITVACSSPGSGSNAQSDGGGGGGGATATPNGGGGGEATATPDGGGGGGGANGSVTYRISGDYETSGELPFVPLGLSLFDSANGGWVAYFAEEQEGSALIQMNTIPTSLIVNYGDGTALVVGTEELGCRFSFSKNDGSGLAGSFECNGLQGFMNASGAAITVDFSGEFEGHP